MNIWIVNQFANTPRDPGPTRQYEIAKHLAARGHQVTVIASDFNTEIRAHRKTSAMSFMVKEQLEGINWVSLYVTPYRVNDWRRYVNILSFWLTLALASTRLPRPQVIIGSSPQLPTTYVAWLIARIMRARFIFEVRDLWPQVMVDMAGSSESSPFIRILRYVERQLYTRSDAVVVLARGSIDYVVARGAPRARTHWLPNSVHADAFLTEARPTELRDRYGLPRNKFVALYAGAHGDANALHTVVDAARLLVDEAPNVHIALFGDGPTKGDLEIRGKDLPNLSFHPPVSKSEMPEVLAAADAGLMPLKDVALFRYGVSPNKLYDYYAAGRPVISSVGGDVNREVEEEGVGFGAQPEDPRSLADAIRACAAMPASEWESMSRRARELVASRYDRATVAQAYEDLIGNVATRPHP